MLSTLEVNLDKFLGAVRRGRERLHERSQESVMVGVGSETDEQPPRPTSPALAERGSLAGGAQCARTGPYQCFEPSRLTVCSQYRDARPGLRSSHEYPAPPTWPAVGMSLGVARVR